MSKSSSKCKLSPQSILRKNIRKFDDPILKEKCRLIDTDKDKDLVSKTIDTMRKTLCATELGVGIAAPQIGETLQICVLRLDPSRFSFKIMINPEIVSHSEDRVKKVEGCLSYPKVFCSVERWKTVKVKYLNENFIMTEEELEEYPSRVAAHEIDHTQGICQVGDYWHLMIEPYISKK